MDRNRIIELMKGLTEGKCQPPKQLDGKILKWTEEGGLYRCEDPEFAHLQGLTEQQFRKLIDVHGGSHYTWHETGAPDADGRSVAYTIIIPDDLLNRAKHNL